MASADAHDQPSPAVRRTSVTRGPFSALPLSARLNAPRVFAPAPSLLNPASLVNFPSDWLLRRRVFYGWWIVAASFGLAGLVSGFIFLGFTAFLVPFTESFDVGRGEISLVFGFSSVAGVAASPLVGRFGARRVTMAGVISMCAGLCLMSLAQNLLHYGLIHLTLVTMGGFVVLFYGSSTVVNNWFDKRRGLAFGVFFTGISLGAALVFVVNFLVETMGWRDATLVIGIFGLVVGLPLASILRDRPEDFGMLPDDAPPDSGPARPTTTARGFAEQGLTLRQALRTSAFWTLSVGFASRNFVIAGMAAHFIPAVVDKGFSTTTGAQMLLVFAGAAFVNRLLTSFISDYVPKAKMTGLMVAIGAGSFLIMMWADTIWGIVLFVVVYSLAWAGSGGGMVSAIRGEFFGRANYAVISGAGNLVQAGGEVLGPAIAGILYDRTGSYTDSYFVFIGMLSLSTVALLLTRAPRASASMS